MICAAEERHAENRGDDRPYSPAPEERIGCQTREIEPTSGEEHQQRDGEKRRNDDGGRTKERVMKGVGDQHARPWLER